MLGSTSPFPRGFCQSSPRSQISMFSPQEHRSSQSEGNITRVSCNLAFARTKKKRYSFCAFPAYCLVFQSEKSRAHKNKVGTSPPPPQPKNTPPPPKTRNFMDIGFLQKERIFSRRPSNWRSHFRPQNCGHEFYGHEDFSDSKRGRKNLRSTLVPV